MKSAFLLDSVVLIEHLNNLPQATKWLVEHIGKSQISLVTRMEVLAGYRPAQAVSIKKFLDRFAVVDLNCEVADWVATLRNEYRWKLPDAVQAGLAQYHGLKLVTRNTKDFPPDKFSFVVVPY